MRSSESERGLICPASLVLPRTRVRSEKTQAAADWGTLCHHWKETGETDPEWAKPSDVLCLEKKLMRTGIRREDYWPTDRGEHEVSFALHLTTLKLTWFRGDKRTAETWKAGFGREYLTGTLDWLGRLPDGRLWIDDLKTGHWPVPPTAPQFKSYTLPLYVEGGRKGDFNLATSVTKWERYPLDGLPTRTWGELLALETEEHLSDLQWSAAHPEEVNRTEEGCRFCDCRPTCPAWAGELNG